MSRCTATQPSTLLPCIPAAVLYMYPDVQPLNPEPCCHASLLQVEQSFNHVCTLWPFIDCVRKHKVFQNGVNNFANLADTWFASICSVPWRLYPQPCLLLIRATCRYAMAFMTNLHTCYYGSHSTAKFGVEPAGAECGPVAVSAYLHSVHNGLMLSQQ